MSFFARNRPASLAVVPAVVGLAMLGGCQGDPVLLDAIAWHGQLSSLMAENTALAYEFQDLAVDVKKKGDDLEADDVAKDLGGDLQQAAAALAAKVPAARPATPDFQTLHDELGEIWTTRAEAYGEVVQAWKAEDREKLLGIAESNKANKQAEQWWLERTNRALAPHKLRIELYPVAAAE